MIASVTTYGLSDAYARPSSDTAVCRQDPEQIARELASTNPADACELPPENCCARCRCPITRLRGEPRRGMCVRCEEGWRRMEEAAGFARQTCRLCPRLVQLTRTSDLCGVCRGQARKKKRRAA